MPAKNLFARLSVVALSVTVMTAMFAGTAYAAAATNTTKGQGPGDGAPTATPTYTWAGSDIVVNLSITTDATLNAQEFWLFGSGGGICVQTDADTITIDGAGRCTVYGRVYSGNTFDASTDEMEIIVNKGNQSALALSTDGTDGVSKKYDESTGLTVSGGTTAGAITYSVTSGDCSVDNDADTATVTTLAGSADNCVIRATMAGDDDYNAVYDEATITVGKADQSALTLSTDGTDGVSKKYGESAALTVSGGTTAGAITYSVTSGDCSVDNDADTATVTTLAGSADNCVIRATMAGDDDYNAVYDEATITVGKADQSALTIKTNGFDGTTAAFGEVVVLTTSGGSSAGAVTYSFTSGDCSVDNDADTATITSLAGTADNCVVGAVMAGGDNYNDKSAPDVTITVTKAGQTALQVLTDGTDGTIAVSPESVALTTSGGSGTGTVVFTKVSGSCNVSGSTATITGSAANCVVEAMQSADDNFFVTTDRATITVNKVSQAALQVLTDGTDGTSATTGESVGLTSSGGSGSGNVTYSKVSGDCDVAGEIATITGSDNNCVVRVTKDADADYLVATDDATITVGPAVTLPTTSASPTVRKSAKNATVVSSGIWAANGGTLSGYSYQWYQCTSSKSAVAAASVVNAPADCVLIVGATSSTWRISGVNLKHLRVLVTRSNEAGSAYAWSATFRR